MKKPILKISENFSEMMSDINNGLFFTVVFTKKDRSIRTMNCRTRVVSYLRGGEKRYDDKDYNLKTVWDRKKKEYRSFPLHEIIELKAMGKIYTQ